MKMKINMSLLEAEQALCSYLKNEFNLNNITAEDISFKNARSVEDMYFEISIKPRKVYDEPKEKRTIEEVITKKKGNENETVREENEEKAGTAEPASTGFSVFGSLKD